jgi:hypothetical protein
MPSLEDIHRKQNASMDALIASFTENLNALTLKAQAKVLAQLQKKLSITDGVIDRTAGNSRILRNLDIAFIKAMNEEGYQELIKAFVGEFPGQLPFLQNTLDAISAGMTEPLPKWTPTTTDTNVLASLQSNTVSALQMTMESVARTATQNVMLTVGGLKFKELASTLAEKFSINVGRAESLADTAIATWQRTATDRAFQFIEKDLPLMEIRYKYALGPDDRKTRPWCETKIDQTKAGKTWKREEINAMDNGQIGNVMVTCGGYNCRHVWLIAFN